MGELDDAIREHLELKRRSGADPGEVARLENEALAEPGSEAPLELESQEGLDASGTAAPDALEDGHDPLADAVAVEVGPARDEPADEVDLEVHEPTPEPDGAPEPASAGQATSEFTVADHEDALGDEQDVVPADEGVGGEDVLEETPDFLQETPEHDRLWFEQRPPRDFDFDG